MSNLVPIGDKTYEEYMDEIESDGHALTDYYLLPGILWKYHILYKWQHAVHVLGYPQAFYH